MMTGTALAAAATTPFLSAAAADPNIDADLILLEQEFLSVKAEIVRLEDQEEEIIKQLPTWAQPGPDWRGMMTRQPSVADMPEFAKLVETGQINGRPTEADFATIIARSFREGRHHRDESIPEALDSIKKLHSVWERRRHESEQAQIKSGLIDNLIRQDGLSGRNSDLLHRIANTPAHSLGGVAVKLKCIQDNIDTDPDCDEPHLVWIRALVKNVDGLCA